MAVSAVASAAETNHASTSRYDPGYSGIAWSGYGQKAELFSFEPWQTISLAELRHVSVDNDGVMMAVKAGKIPLIGSQGRLLVASLMLHVLGNKHAQARQNIGEEVPSNMTRAFLNYVRIIPRLNPSEEIGLGRIVQAGNAQTQVHGIDTEKLRQTAILLGTEANYGLAVRIARRYLSPLNPFSLLDLTHAGVPGLMAAWRGYDPARGKRFSSYASYLVLQAINDFMRTNSRLIRLPANHHDNSRKIRRAESNLLQVLQREPTYHELSEATNVPEETIMLIRRAESVESFDEQSEDAEAEVGPQPNGRLAQLVQSEIKNWKQLFAIQSKWELNGEVLTDEQIAARLSLTEPEVRAMQKSAVKTLQLAIRRQGLKKEDFYT